MHLSMKIRKWLTALWQLEMVPSVEKLFSNNLDFDLGHHWVAFSSGGGSFNVRKRLPIAVNATPLLVPVVCQSGPLDRHRSLWQRRSFRSGLLWGLQHRSPERFGRRLGVLLTLRVIHVESCLRGFSKTYYVSGPPNALVDMCNICVKSDTFQIKLDILLGQIDASENKVDIFQIKTFFHAKIETVQDG